MAKKSVRKNIKPKTTDLEKTVNFLYQNGFLQSTIVHTVVLLIMALTVFSEPQTKPVKIHLSFSSVSDQQEVSLDQAIEMPAENNESSSIASLEQENTLAISQTIELDQSKSNIEVALEETIVDQTSHDLVDDLSLSDLNREIIKETPKQIKQTRQFTRANTNTPETNNPGIIGELSDILSQGNNTSQDNVFGGSGNLNDINRRLSNAGAKTGDVQISIAWNTTDDIDLHVSFRTIHGETYTISWMNRMVGHGMLDVDMNANPGQLTNRPVENIFWTKGSSPKGEFVVYVHSFRNWSGSMVTPVTVVLKSDDQHKTININVRPGPPAEVIRFRR